jgi:hypothetical protein
MRTSLLSRWLSPGQRTQLKIGMIAGFLAMGVYWAKEPEHAVESTRVLTVIEEVPLGDAVQQVQLGHDDVPTEVATDFILDTEEHRALVSGRVAREALQANTRLVPSMFPGGLSGDLQAGLPAGHRGVTLSVEDIPASTERGMRVDVFDGRRRVAQGVLVMSSEPFTVAVPVEQFEPFLGLDEVTVVSRPDIDAGELPVPEPRTAAPVAAASPPTVERPAPPASARTILNRR